MLKTTRLLTSTLLLALFLGGRAWALGGGPPGPALGPAWDGLQQAARSAGVEERPLAAALEALSSAGVDPVAARGALQPALRSAKAGLPATWVLEKITEGARKGAALEELTRTATHREELLARARALSGTPPRQDPGLLTNTALALESGLEEPALRSLFDAGRGRSDGDLRDLVASGEAFHLSGLDSATVGQLMIDCLDRRLRRSELQRVVRQVRRSSTAGLAGGALRAALWTPGSGASQGAGAGQRTGAGESGGSGRGQGAGPGGAGPGGPAGSGGGGGRGPGGPGHGQQR